MCVFFVSFPKSVVLHNITRKKKIIYFIFYEFFMFILKTLLNEIQDNQKQEIKKNKNVFFFHNFQIQLFEPIFQIEI